MYSSKKNGFSILDLLVKIIFAAIFIFILIWLFNKKIPKINMTPFYSNVFRENLKYMQDAGENYFTDDKMPTEEGEEIKLTLGEMESKNLIIPFVDEDGNACDKNDSYVSITKLEEGYELKTNLVCPKESNFIVKTLGCHTYCKTGNCEKKCSVQKITEYQYKKLISGSKTTYSCPKGTKLSGKYCFETKLVASKNPTTKTTTKVERKPATVVTTDAKVVKLDTVVTKKKVQLTTVVGKKKVEVPVAVSTREVLLTTIVGSKKTQLKTEVKTETVKEPYDCTKTRTVKKCHTEYQTRSYSCQCKTTVSGGRSTTTCNTCYETVPVQKCKDVKETYTDTCYREVSKTTYTCPSGTTEHTGSGKDLKCYKVEPTYSCPSGTQNQVGSGKDLKCFKTETVYACPAGTDEHTGSGSSLKCYKYENTYSCPSGTEEQVGSGSSLKCYKYEKVYSCPSGTTYSEGSGSSLKCYKVISGTISYKCSDSRYTLDGKYCVRTITTTAKVCDKGYKLENNKCNKYKTTKTKAKKNSKTSSYYTYKWSEETSLPGYTKTGKTRTKDGKEVCE